jgi:hypothetical protein
MIEFLSVKGKGLPVGLRGRVMGLYGIMESDFADDVIGRWKSGDEIVETEASYRDVEFDKKGSYREQIRALELAFQSQIPELTCHPLERPHSPLWLPSVKRQRSEVRISKSGTSNLDHVWNAPVIDPRESISEPGPGNSGHGFYMQGALSSSLSVNTVASDTSRNTMASTNTTNSIDGENETERLKVKGIFGMWKKEKGWKGGIRVAVVRRAVVY